MNLLACKTRRRLRGRAGLRRNLAWAAAPRWRGAWAAGRQRAGRQRAPGRQRSGSRLQPPRSARPRHLRRGISAHYAPASATRARAARLSRRQPARCLRHPRHACSSCGGAAARTSALLSVRSVQAASRRLQRLVSCGSRRVAARRVGTEGVSSSARRPGGAMRAPTRRAARCERVSRSSRCAPPPSRRRLGRRDTPRTLRADSTSTGSGGSRRVCTARGAAHGPALPVAHAAAACSCARHAQTGCVAGGGLAACCCVRSPCSRPQRAAMRHTAVCVCAPARPAAGALARTSSPAAQCVAAVRRHQHAAAGRARATCTQLHAGCACRGHSAGRRAREWMSTNATTRRSAPSTAPQLQRGCHRARSASMQCVAPRGAGFVYTRCVGSFCARVLLAGRGRRAACVLHPPPPHSLARGAGSTIVTGSRILASSSALSLVSSTATSAMVRPVAAAFLAILADAS